MSNTTEKKAQQPQNARKLKKLKKTPSSPEQEAIEKTQETIHDFFYMVSEDGKDEARFDTSLLCIDCGIVIALLGSACWAASIASARRHNAFISFILGLVLPWIYPLVILLAMGIPGQWDLAKQKRDKEKAEREAVIAEAEANDVKQDEDGNITYEPTPAYFNKIARTPDGEPAGPWKAVVNGNPVIVVHILEALPEALSVEFKDNKGEIMKMRIPYVRINSWEEYTDTAQA